MCKVSRLNWQPYSLLYDVSLSENYHNNNNNIKLFYKYLVDLHTLILLELWLQCELGMGSQLSGRFSY